MFTVKNSNYKNTLLEISQRYFGAEPQYIHFDYGPSHAKVFRCICSFRQQMTSSEGRTKIEAEQLASQAMLNKIKHLHFEQTDIGWTFSNTVEPATLSTHVLKILSDLKNDVRFDVLSLYGNAVIRYVIAQYLYDRYTEFHEGILTLVIAEAMRVETRAQIALHLKLETYVKTEPTSRVLAETLDAAMGRLSLVAPNNLAEKIILDHYQPFIDYAVAIVLNDSITINEQVVAARIKTTIHNFKNQLQEYAQKRSLILPSYSFIRKEGIEHAPIFTVKCEFKKMATVGEGATIKSAEQDAAKNMLENIFLDDMDKERSISRSQAYTNFSVPDSAIDEHNLERLKHHLHLPHFVSLSHLITAFTHPSLDNENNYQRLEFLGDAVLRMLLLDYLLRNYPKITDKSFLSPLVDKLVSAETQTKIAKKLRLHKYALSATTVTDGMLSDILEALVAAIYIDVKDRFIGFALGNKSIPIILDWFKSQIINNLGEYHMTTEGVAGSDNFPELTASSTSKKTIALTSEQGGTYTEIAARMQNIKKSPSIPQPARTPEEDFPPLTTRTTKTELSEDKPKLDYAKAASKTQRPVSVKTSLEIRFVSKAPTSKLFLEINSKPFSLK